MIIKNILTNFAISLLGIIYTSSMENDRNNIIKQKLKDIKNARENVEKLIADCTKQVSSFQYLFNINKDVQKFSYKIKNTK